MTEAACLAALRPMIDSVATHIAARQITVRTATLKLRYADFTTVTRCRTVPSAIADATGLGDVTAVLLSSLCPLSSGVRLLGVTLSNLSPAMHRSEGSNREPTLF